MSNLEKVSDAFSGDLNSGDPSNAVFFGCTDSRTLHLVRQGIKPALSFSGISRKNPGVGMVRPRKSCEVDEMIGALDLVLYAVGAGWQHQVSRAGSRAEADLCHFPTLHGIVIRCLDRGCEGKHCACHSG